MKIKLLFILPLAVTVTLFVSCSKDDDSSPIKNMKAEPGIIGVDSHGELTLDGWKAENPAYIVYFKWGSVIAMNGTKKWIDAATNIAWAPEEYKSKLNDITNYWAVPYADVNNYPFDFPPQLPEDGLGDPCQLAKKDGIAGGYRMPTVVTVPKDEEDEEEELTLEQFTDGGWTKSGGTFGQPGRKSIQGQFYPAAGYRSNFNGSLSYFSSWGSYWSSIPSSTTSATSLALALNFNSGSTLDKIMSNYRDNGFSIRCVAK